MDRSDPNFRFPNFRFPTPISGSDPNFRFPTPLSGSDPTFRFTTPISGSRPQFQVQATPISGSSDPNFSSRNPGETGHRAVSEIVGTGGVRPAPERSQNHRGRGRQYPHLEALRFQCRSERAARGPRHRRRPEARYYGWYSNKSRGLRAKSGSASAGPRAVARPRRQRSASALGRADQTGV